MSLTIKSVHCANNNKNELTSFYDKLSQSLFSLFLKSELQYLCMSLSKFRTSLSLVWRKCHPKIIGYAEKISKSEPNLKYLRICIYCFICGCISLDVRPENNPLLSTVTSLLSALHYHIGCICLTFLDSLCLFKRWCKGV